MADEPLKPEPEHLPPEVFVDLVEGAPVDALWRQHAEECDPCRAELVALGDTLDELRSEADASQRLSGRPHRLVEAIPIAMPGRRLWLSAVAVLLLGLSVWWFRSALQPEEPASRPTALRQAELLPPAAEDADFQFLLAVFRAVDETMSSEAEEELFGIPVVEPDELSIEEQRDLMDELVQAMRAESS